MIIAAEFRTKVTQYAHKYGLTLREELWIEHKGIAIWKAWSNERKKAALIYISIGPNDVRTISHFIFSQYETYTP